MFDFVSFSSSGLLADFNNERGQQIRVRKPRTVLNPETKRLIEELVNVIEDDQLVNFCQKKANQTHGVKLFLNQLIIIN